MSLESVAHHPCSCPCSDSETQVPSTSKFNHSLVLMGLVSHASGKEKQRERALPAFLSSFLFLFIFFLFRAAPEVPWLGAKLELQMPVSATAMEVLDPSDICNLCHSLWQCQILNPLSKAGVEPTSLWILCQVLNPLNHNGNSMPTS